jgi:hypothetical protein
MGNLKEVNITTENSKVKNVKENSRMTEDIMVGNYRQENVKWEISRR